MPIIIMVVIWTLVEFGVTEGMQVCHVTCARDVVTGVHRYMYVPQNQAK